MPMSIAEPTATDAVVEFASDEWVDTEFAAIMAASGMAKRLGALLAPWPCARPDPKRQAGPGRGLRFAAAHRLCDRARTRSPPEDARRRRPAPE